MKISLLSDIHFEFHKDGGNSFIASLDSSKTDVLLLAGDVGTITYLDNAVSRFCDKFSQVVHVAGNHEFWNSRREEVIEKLLSLSAKKSNYHFLDNNIFEHQGRRFLGTTMWFSEPSPRLCRYWSDYHKIKDFSIWIRDQNRDSTEFLKREMREGDIVITHHLPSYKSVAPQFIGDATNAFFVCEMEYLIEERKPALWCHGHTHCATRYNLFDTEVVCNPLGYVGHEFDTGFNDKLLIEF